MRAKTYVHGLPLSTSWWFGGMSGWAYAAPDSASSSVAVMTTTARTGWRDMAVMLSAAARGQRGGGDVERAGGRTDEPRRQPVGRERERDQPPRPRLHDAGQRRDVVE